MRPTGLCFPTTHVLWTWTLQDKAGPARISAETVSLDAFNPFIWSRNTKQEEQTAESRFLHEKSSWLDFITGSFKQSTEYQWVTLWVKPTNQSSASTQPHVLKSLWTSDAFTKTEMFKEEIRHNQQRNSFLLLLLLLHHFLQLKQNPPEPQTTDSFLFSIESCSVSQTCCDDGS